MASAQTLPANSAQAVFRSVFSPGSIRPATQRQKTGYKNEAFLTEVRSILTEDIGHILGVGDDDFVYGLDSVTSDGQPFKHIDKLKLPITQIRQPKAEEDVIQHNKYANLRMWTLLPRWQTYLGTSAMKKLLANIAEKLMLEYIAWSYAGRYCEDVEIHLEFWVEHVFAKTMLHILSLLDKTQPSKAHTPSTPSSDELSKWQEMAKNKFGALRIGELFDIVVAWDETRSGIQDLRHFATHPATRQYLTNNFTNALIARLLHPGASTIEILQVYMSIIRAFRILDPRGVLLDRVTRKLRRYLKERDDTVKMLVAGMLSDPAQDIDMDMAAPQPDTHAEEKVFADVAQELHRSGTSAPRTDEGDLDWNNMEWVPDPVDAAPDYMRSKNTDVIGSLISLFDSKDAFVKELQLSLSDRLLENKPDFQLETSVIEHLKIRFGDAALQGCEVMMRDVQDSRKVDAIIRREQKMSPDDATESQPEFHSKILSRLFWPSFQDQPFTIPEPILSQQTQYEQGFSALKQSRKLTWHNNIGHVEVQLDFEDRSITEEVLPWQASVIWQFQNNPSTSTEPLSLTVSELSTNLEMSLPLVRAACIFWTSKRVLTETSKDKYTVLETLPSDLDPKNPTTTTATTTTNEAALIAAQAAAEEQAALAMKEAELQEKKQQWAIYHQFVKSMLTNQGAMPLARIGMMLNIVVPGGFGYGTDELRDFLTGMVRDGVLEMGVGGNYKVVGP